MEISQILLSKQINPSRTIMRITAADVLYSLKEALDEFSLTVDFSKLSKEEMEKILSDYAEAMQNYHQDDFHRERATLIENEPALKKCGLRDEDFVMLDFA